MPYLRLFARVRAYEDAFPPLFPRDEDPPRAGVPDIAWKSGCEGFQCRFYQ